MSGQDLIKSQDKLKEDMERLEKQNERIKEIEQKIQKLEDKNKEGVYIQKLKEELKLESNKKDEIENIYSLSEMQVEEIKTKAKEMALVAYKSGEYELYKEYDLIAQTNEKGLMEIEPNYLKELEEKIPARYLNQEEIEPEKLENMSKEADKTNLKEEEKEQEKENSVEKLKEDTGLEIVSLVKIVDENFSNDIVGRNTGYAEQYMAVTKNGSIKLVGLRPDNEFEVNSDFADAQVAKVDEQPGECGKSSVDLVVPRKDGTTSSLGIDMNYGEITLTNRDKEEPIETSNYKPTELEKEKNMLEEEKHTKRKIEHDISEDKEEEKKKEEEEREQESENYEIEERKFPWM